MSCPSAQASASSTSASNGPECEPCRSAKSTRGVEGSSSNGSRTPPSTTTHGPSNPSRATSSQPGSPASPSASPAGEQGRTTTGGCGLPSSEQFAWLDPATSSWKTFQVSLLSDLETFCGAWPSSGSMRSGRCSERGRREPFTGGIGGGSSLLPTPTSSEYGTNRGGSSGLVGPARPSLGHMARHDLWPTPQASQGGQTLPEGSTDTGIGRDGKKRTVGLSHAVKRSMWPTPTKTDGVKAWASPPGDGSRGLDTLSGQVQNRMWATPTRADGLGGPDYRIRPNGAPLRSQVGGSLNPAWVELLMGCPAGWTDPDVTFPSPPAGLTGHGKTGCRG